MLIWFVILPFWPALLIAYLVWAVGNSLEDR